MSVSMEVEINLPKLKNFPSEKILQSVKNLVLVEIDKNFQSRGRDEKGKIGVWKPSEKMRNPNRKGTTLIMTGKLLNSIIGNIKGNEIIIGTNARSEQGFSYGRLHNRGGKIHPQRKFLMVPEPTKQKIIKQITKNYGE